MSPATLIHEEGNLKFVTNDRSGVTTATYKGCYILKGYMMLHGKNYPSATRYLEAGPGEPI